MGRLLRKKKTVNVNRKKESPNNGDLSAGQTADAPDLKSASPGEKTEKKRVMPLQKKAAPVAPKEGYIQNSIQFLREVRAELKKVAWPSRKQTVGSTVVVIALVVVISAFLGVVDVTLSSLIQLVMK